MKTCFNCGSEVPSDKLLCPNCGIRLDSNTSWPPAPTNVDMLVLPETEKLVTGNRKGDLYLGFLVSWLPIVLYVIGLFLSPILYFLFRKSYPTFGDGIGYGLMSMVFAFVVLVIVSLAWGPGNK